MGTAATSSKVGAKTKRSGAAKVATVTVGQLRSNFKAVEAKLAKGVRVQVTRRGEVVAEVVPAHGVKQIEQTAAPIRFIDRLPAIEADLREIWGDQPWDIDTTALISEGRDRDFLS
jgi:antitoxin (DNA-binding transcriptional repressor) of toxin-antitoxin stability system